MKIKRLIAVLMTTIMLFGSSFVNLSSAAEPMEVLRGQVHLSLDKTIASVGDIITATLYVKDFEAVAGYQANIKYDPQVLQPVYLDGTPYDIGSTVELGDLLKKRYSPTEVASHDFTKGTLSFGRTYMAIDNYRYSGVPENTGSIAVIGFKVLKNLPTAIKLEDCPMLPDEIDGTMIFDWNARQLSGYKVFQAPTINSCGLPTPPAEPTITPTSIIKNGEIYLTVDRASQSVGDIIIATLNVKYFDVVAGYQANIKYDPEVLQPVYLDGYPYDLSTVPERGTLLQRRYSPTEFASNDLEKGTLTFGRSYMNIQAYKASGVAENTGSIAVIGFKVLKAVPGTIKLEDSPNLSNQICGTMIFDWDGRQLSEYEVSQAPTINSCELPTTSTEPTIAPTSIPKSPLVYLEVNKMTGSIGDIITVTLNVRGFDVIAGYQANIKYDPEILQPVYSDGTAYDSMSAPEYGTLLQKRYSPTDMASNNLIRGTLTFGRTYMNLQAYSVSGTPEKEGSIAVIKFKILKIKPCEIMLEDSTALTNQISGTMIFDWDGKQLSNYRVEQPFRPRPSTTPIPTPTSSATPTGFGRIGRVSIDIDRTVVSVGDIVKATLYIKNFEVVGGYQANIKYDPQVLQPVYEDGSPYDSSSSPEYGTLLLKRFAPTDMASNDLIKGTLTFGRTYMNMQAYKASGVPENEGTLAVIRFKVLKVGVIGVSLEDSPALTNPISGTMIFDWDGRQLSNYNVFFDPNPSNTPTPTALTTASATSTTVVNTPSSTPAGKVMMNFNRKNVSVGALLRAEINIDKIENFAGFQCNIKYDKNYLQPWDIITNAPYDTETMPDYGTLLMQRKYIGFDLAVHDLEKGILNFGRAYMDLAKYKSDGKPENSGKIAVITFKVIKEIPAEGAKVISFEDSSITSDEKNGILLFNWDGETLGADKYTVIQPEALLPEKERMLYGDVDSNGQIDSDDYAYMKQYLLGMIDEFPNHELGLIAADVDGDGNFDSDDYALMRQMLLGMIVRFPVEVNGRSSI